MAILVAPPPGSVPVGWSLNERVASVRLQVGGWILTAVEDG